MKNEAKVLYRYVLQTMELNKSYLAGKVPCKQDYQYRYAKIMADELEEKTLKNLDNIEAPVI